MAIRPLDLQVSIPRSSEVLKANNSLANRPDAQQQEFSNILQKKTQDDNTRVLENQKADKNGVDKDGRSGGSAYSKKKNKNKKLSNIKSEKKQKEHGSVYDFTV